MQDSKIQRRQTWIKDVTAPSIEDAIMHLDGLSGSCFDMAIISVEMTEDTDTYITLKVVGWENYESRQAYSI